MLKQMRKGAHGIFAKLLIIALIASFAVWGVGDMVNGTPSNAVATVGDISISAQRYDRALERVRRSFGSHYTSELFNQLGVPEQVLNALINNALLSQEAEKLGLSFSDTTLAERIRSNPDFSNNSGEFDRQLFSLVLRDNRISEKTYLQILREELSIGSLEGALSNVPLSNAALVNTLYNATHEQRDASILLITDRNIPAIGTPEEGELEKMYAERKSMYQTPEYRGFSFVEVDLEELATNVEVTEEDALNYYDQNAAEFDVSERRSVVQWLFANEEDAEKALDERSSEMTASPAKAEVENGTYSDLGTVEKASMAEMVSGEVFGTRVGSLTKPLKTGFGWHVFMVRDIFPASKKPFSDVKTSIFARLKDAKKTDALSNISISIEDMIAGGASLDTIAQEYALKVQSFGPVTQDGVPESGKAKKLNDAEKYILNSHFSSAETQLSDLSLGANSHYFVVRTDNVIESAPRPFEEVKAMLLDEWTALEKRRAKLGRANEVLEMIKTNNSQVGAAQKLAKLVATKNTERSAQELKLTNGKTLNTTGAFVQTLFNTNVGETTTPFPLPDGNYAIGVVTKVTPAPALTDKNVTASETIIRELNQQYKSEILDHYLKYLRGKYSITINDALYREVAGR